MREKFKTCAILALILILSSPIWSATTSDLLGSAGSASADVSTSWGDFTTNVSGSASSSLSATTCGAVNYSGGAALLAECWSMLTSMMLCVLEIVFSIAMVCSIISSLQIYVKMQAGEEGVTKAIYNLLAAMVFLLGASLFLPGLYGYTLY